MTRPRSSTSGSLAATINDVAARAGVSKRTVTRVMNDEPYVTETTRGRVLSAVERLGYRPDPVARRLAGGRSQLVGLFHSGSAPPDAALVETVAFAMARKRYRLLVCSSDYHAANAAEEVASLARDVPIDGAIVCPPLSELPAFGHAFRQHGIPCVRIGPAVGSHSICANDREAARQMTQYLASLGHGRIAFVCGPSEHDTLQQRLQGFLDGMEMSGVAIDADLVVQGTDTFDSGVECGRQLLSDARSRPSAIFASTDVMAAGVMMAAHELGIAVPAGLSVAGFGDQPVASQVWPTLTTVRPPMRALADRAAAVLLDLLHGSNAASDETPVLSGEIVLRNSTGVPAR